MTTKFALMKKQLRVAIVMGSDSDLPVMKEASDILTEFGINFEVTIVSAHRTPDRMFAYAKSAEKRKIGVIIAGAGGAAHVAGVTAALTTIPVIGVPIQSKTLNGIDSLYSIVQMPPGIPVATVAINGAKNAGILAAEILAVGDTALRKKIQKYKDKLSSDVEIKAKRLEKLGPAKYLDENNKSR